jgi:cupin fold WbuC family metalloprotein
MIKRFHASQLQDLVLAAGQSDRGRAHLNTHDSLDAPVQRLFIATSRDTYIRPHRHSEKHKSEFFLLVEGRMDLLLFGDDGEIIERCRMSGEDTRAVEIPAGRWHSYVCCQPGTFAFEIKQGAYVPTAEADFAPWSPAEGTPACDGFLRWMRIAGIGSTPA